MKRYIKSASEVTNSQIVDVLKSHGIDTTKCQYELKGQRYERYEEGQRYTVKFTCPGDYLAYFSMMMHKQPNADGVEYWFNNIEEFNNFVDEHPTVKAIKKYMSISWWGDGDDYILYLKNLTTGKTLYQGRETDEKFTDEGDWED